MKSKTVIIIAAVVVMGGIFVFLSKGNKNDQTQAASNVSIVDGTQIIEIKAKGGYSPRLTQAKANMPTIIKVKTEGTFDCSSALTVPSLSYQKNLPPSGVTEIRVPQQQAGTSLKGLCSMAMYNFSVQFN